MSWQDKYETAPVPSWSDKYVTEEPGPLSKATATAADSPDEAAKAIKIGKDLGLEPSLVEGDLPGYEESAKRAAAAKAAQDPQIADYITNFPGYKVSNDDWPMLESIGKWAKKQAPFTWPEKPEFKKIDGRPPIWSEILTTPEGRENLLSLLEYYPLHVLKGLVDLVKLPGEALQRPLTPEEEAAFGFGIGMFGVKMGRTPFRMGTGEAISTKAEMESFMGSAEGFRLREEIDAFIRTKEAKTGGPADSQMRLLPPPKPKEAPPPPDPASVAQVKNGELPHQGQNPVSDAVRIAQSQKALDDFNGLYGEVQNSKTLQRSPEAMEKYLTPTLGHRSVGIAYETVVKLYGDNQPTPNDGLLGFVPDFQKQLELARETGADVEVPVPLYLSRMDKTVHDQIKDGIRIREDGLTAEEIKGLKEAEEPVKAETPEKKEASKKDEITINEDPKGTLIKHGEPPNDSLISVYPQKDAVYIGVSQVAKSQKGIGVGRRLYEEAVKYAAERGLPLRSDISVSADAVRVYEALKRRGYQVSIAEGSTKTKEGISNVSAGYVYEVRPPTPETIRAMEIADAERRSLYLHSLFSEAEALKITESELARYSKKIEELEEAQLAKMTETERRAIARVRTEQWKRDLAEIRTEVEADLRSSPELAAARFFETGQLPTGEKITPPRLNRNIVEQQLGKDAMNKITTMVAEKGVHPDEYAEMFGFGSGKEMVSALWRVWRDRHDQGLSLRQYTDRAIRAEADARMLAKYGDLDQLILEEARDAALAKYQVDILAEELRILARQKETTPPISREQMEEWAEARFAELSIKQGVKYENFRRAAEKQGREAEKALLKGAIEDAFLAKQRQMMSILLAKQSRDLAKELVKAERLLDRFRAPTVPQIEQVYTNQIHRLMERIGRPARRDSAELADALRGASLDRFAEAQAQLGGEIALTDYLVDGIWQKDFDGLTTTEFRDVMEAIDSLAHAGREAKKVRVGEEKRALEEVRNDIVSRLQTRPLRGEKENKAYLFDAMWVKPEELFRAMDNLDAQGPFSSIFRNMKDAQKKKEELTDRVTKKFQVLYQDKAWRKSLTDMVENNFFADPRSPTGELFKINREQMINIAYYFGSRSGINAFVGGYATPSGKLVADPLLLERRLRNFLETQMRKEDWDFVQGVWDVYAELRPEINELYRDLTGRPFQWVKAEKINTPFGEYAGGYYPIIHDKLRSDITVIREKGLEDGYVRATTPNGYTKVRVKNPTQPIDFLHSADQALYRIQQEIHDIAFRRAIYDAGKVLYDPQIRSAIRNYYGQEYEAQIDPWLKYIGNRMNYDERSVRAANSLMSRVRGNLITHALGLNLNVILSPDIGALFNPSFAKQFAWMSRTPVAFMEEWQFALSKSHELPRTMQNLDRDLAEQFEKLAARGGWSPVQRKIAHAAMMPAAKFSQVFRTATFLVEYRKALAEGKAEAEAVHLADSAVRQRHGAHHQIDLSAMMRSESMKTWTLFQGYFATVYNWQRSVPDALRHGEYMHAASVMFHTMAYMALMNYFLFNRDKENDSVARRITKAVALAAVAPFPFINSFANYILEGNETRLPFVSVARATEAVIQDHIMNWDRPSRRPISNAMNIVGMTFGLPLGQIGKTTQFLYDVNSGKQRPMSFGEWLHGLRTGKAREGFRR